MVRASGAQLDRVEDPLLPGHEHQQDGYLNRSLARLRNWWMSMGGYQRDPGTEEWADNSVPRPSGATGRRSTRYFARVHIYIPSRLPLV
jgi:hypothetical protein